MNSADCLAHPSGTQETNRNEAGVLFFAVSLGQLCFQYQAASHTFTPVTLLAEQDGNWSRTQPLHGMDPTKAKQKAMRGRPQWWKRELPRAEDGQDHKTKGHLPLNRCKNTISLTCCSSNRQSTSVSEAEQEQKRRFDSLCSQN